MQSLHVALIGYGNAGRIFHAPLISGVPGLHLVSISSSKPDAVLADWPEVQVVVTPQAAFDDPAIDLVVIATGNESHFPLARQALLAGKHVVVDKPCTVTLAQTTELLQLAQSVGKVLTVFQNRRFDADFLALRQVISSGELGRIVHFESHFDRYRPVVPDRWREQDLPGSGLWFDLGSHLVDQALQLFGMPQDLSLDTAVQRDGAQVNDYFHAQLRYPQTYPGLRVVLHASALVPAVGPRFVVHGTRGSFVKYGLDGQEDALKAGARPQLDALQNWGKDDQVGTLTIYHQAWTQTSAAPDCAGNYLQYYAGLRDFLRGQTEAPPVTPNQVAQAMQLLTLGEQSAREGRFVPVPVAVPL
ncbi:MAG: oxidoreductase [Burkholderiales bacterium]|nr:oxidoreductase [Burkholderiales bacterium]